MGDRECWLKRFIVYPTRRLESHHWGANEVSVLDYAIWSDRVHLPTCLRSGAAHSRWRLAINGNRLGVAGDRGVRSSRRSTAQRHQHFPPNAGLDAQTETELSSPGLCAATYSPDYPGSAAPGARTRMAACPRCQPFPNTLRGPRAASHTREMECSAACPWVWCQLAALGGSGIGDTAQTVPELMWAATD